MEPAGLDGFAVGVLIFAFRRRWRALGGLRFGPGLSDRAAVFVGELNPTNLVGVTADSEFAFVMQPVMMRTERYQVPCISRAVVFPVDDVMYLDEMILRTAWYPASAVTQYDYATGAFGNDPLAASD